MKDFAEFIRDFMDTVDIDRAFLVGHSLGGRSCLELARQAPDRVGKLVLVAPIGFGKLSATGVVLGTAGWALYKLLRKPLPYPELDIELEEPRVDGFREIDIPCLVLWGRWDTYFPSAYARRVAEAIPNSTVRLFRRSGHSPHRREPSTFNRWVLDFLSTDDVG